MSLILEALRKSEAERQLGRLPGLMSPTIPAPSRRRHRRGWWFALPVVLLLGLGGGWWLAHRVPATLLPAPGPGMTTVPATGSAAPAAADATPADTAPNSASMAANPAASPSTAGNTPPAANTATTAPGQSPPPRPAAPVTTPAAKPEVAAASASPAVPVPPPALPSPGSAALPTATDDPRIADSIPLTQMPSAQRAALPPLKLSVHVYADDPARRFAVIDGQRRIEGAELGQGVRIREIQRGGVLLDVNGQPWLLERPR